MSPAPSITMPIVAESVRQTIANGLAPSMRSAGSYAKLNGMMNPESARSMAVHCVRHTSAPAIEDVA